jgi:hypothetical protein
VIYLYFSRRKDFYITSMQKKRNTLKEQIMKHKNLIFVAIAVLALASYVIPFGSVATQVSGQSYENLVEQDIDQEANDNKNSDIDQEAENNAEFTNSNNNDLDQDIDQEANDNKCCSDIDQDAENNADFTNSDNNDADQDIDQEANDNFNSDIDQDAENNVEFH